MKKILTLCIVHDDKKVLLGMKKRGFGEGRWNGFGGKVKNGETIKEATIRETDEEASIKVTDLKKRGILEFNFESGEEDTLQVHIFSTTAFTGKPSETEEMQPQWFKFDEIPYKDMWPDDKYWLPELLKGKCFDGNFLFGGENDDVLRYNFNVRECD